jgi:hypothetical protein
VTTTRRRPFVLAEESRPGLAARPEAESRRLRKGRLPGRGSASPAAISPRGRARGRAPSRRSQRRPTLGARGAQPWRRPSGRRRDVRRAGPAAERGDPLRRLRQAFLRDPTGADRVERSRVDTLDPPPRAGRGRAERVRTRGQSPDRRFLEAERRAHARHLERVGDDQAVEAELAAQRPAPRGSARSALPAASSSEGTADDPGMPPSNARRDGARELEQCRLESRRRPRPARGASRAAVSP